MRTEWPCCCTGIGPAVRFLSTHYNISGKPEQGEKLVLVQGTVHISMILSSSCSTSVGIVRQHHARPAAASHRLMRPQFLFLLILRVGLGSHYIGLSYRTCCGTGQVERFLVLRVVSKFPFVCSREREKATKRHVLVYLTIVRCVRCLRVRVCLLRLHLQHHGAHLHHDQAGRRAAQPGGRDHRSLREEGYKLIALKVLE